MTTPEPTDPLLPLPPDGRSEAFYEDVCDVPAPATRALPVARRLLARLVARRPVRVPRWAAGASSAGC